jgi:hypothetical protein
MASFSGCRIPLVVKTNEKESRMQGEGSLKVKSLLLLPPPPLLLHVSTYAAADRPLMLTRRAPQVMAAAATGHTSLPSLPVL